MSTETKQPRERGPIAWMVHNRVTPNLLMIALIGGGLYMSTRIKQEVFPEFEMDIVRITVVYPGASPEEVETGILLSIENVLRGLDGIKILRATAHEGVGVVVAELYEDADRQRVYQEIKQSVDRITTFPLDIERPEVTLVAHRHEVIDLAVYGDVSELVLRETAERVRERLLLDPTITQVDIRGGRPYRVLVEIPESRLRRYGLTLQEVANRIKDASVEIPGGKLETRAGQLLLRVTDRRDWARQFARIPVVVSDRGAVVHLEDLATVKEGFEDTNQYATFENVRGMIVEIYRVGSQTPMEVSAAVRKILYELRGELPPGIKCRIMRDRTEIYSQRLELLLRNAFLGLILVLVLLGLFLEVRLAFWVTMGIPTSFLGALLFLPAMGVSINIISMFAFIVALGIVVDDAIVAGENIYELRSEGMSFVQAAIRGAGDVSIPIAFSILTNIVAFLPIYFMEGHMGKIWKVIPLVVITVFVISWVEALIVLPAHLAHIRRRTGPPGRFVRWKQRVASGLDWFILKAYAPFLNRVLRWRLLTMAISVAMFVAVLGYIGSGRIGVILMPRVESDRAVVTAVLPFGSPVARVDEVRDRLVRAAHRVAKGNGSERLMRGVAALVEENRIEVVAYLGKPDVRPLTTRAVTQKWRQEVGVIPGLESLRFESDRGGPGSGAALTVELSHRDISILRAASEELAARLAEFPPVKDIDDGYTPGKQQLNFRISEAGQSLGLTSREVGRQVRNAFYGAEAVRQQRNRDEMRVLVRYPLANRTREFDVENLLVATPTGTRVPLGQLASLERGRAYTSIDRRDGRRTVTVTADVQPIGKSSEILGTMNQTLLPELIAKYPGLTFSYEGRQASMRESVQSLLRGFVVSLFVMYFLLAIPFRSYVQPLIVMTAIPFGIVGATLGHMALGYNLSVMSMMGAVALSGVVVNDSLVLIDYANRQRRAGLTPGEAIRQAGARRFRPIVLTTLTTFGGLAPMIFETSRQARFMIPMAISLGFGILFATVITLVLVPCLYMFIEDFGAFTQRLRQRFATDPPAPELQSPDAPAPADPRTGP
ncbi:MAG: efflux RND transporter permease subunit [bacterium]